MRNIPTRNPYHSYAGKLFDEYPAHSEIGRILRRGDAKKRLAEMDEVEAMIAQQERQHAEVADRIARTMAEHELNMHYLMHFGVRADEREEFRQLLGETADHGGLSLVEAANLAQALHTAAARSSEQDSLRVTAGAS